MELYVSVKLVFISTCIHLISMEEVFTNRFIFRIDSGRFTEVADLLKEEGFLYNDTFFPGVYVFQRDGEDGHEKEDLEQLQKRLGPEVEVIEQVVDFYFQPEPSAASGHETRKNDLPINRTEQIDYSTYKDMGILGAWQVGYTGRGVAVAVLDVGVDVKLQDLYENIDTNQQWNYINNNSDVSPSILHSYPGWHGKSDHGNNCGGLIAAVKGNGICGDGVAFGSKIVPSKVVDLMTVHGYPSLIAPADAITKGLLAYRQNVDIFSSSWSKLSPISEQKSFRLAMQEGVTKGRNGKGSIYVFPVADIGDPFANDFRTITVNGVGTEGRPERYTEQSSAVLTTAYGQGIARQTNDLRTPSAFGTNCSDTFRGTSAATAIVAGIIALALEANNELSWRDMQHLIVESSELEGLHHHYNGFKSNGANKYYHSHLGFGLLNATKLVMMAKNWTSVTPVAHHQLDFEGPCTKTSPGMRQCISKKYCSPDQRMSCVTRLEHLLVTLSPFTSSLDEVVVESPSGTRSTLLGFSQSVGQRSTNKMTFTTVHFWGENPAGTWIVRNRVSDASPLYRVRLDIRGEADIQESAPSTEESVGDINATKDDRNTDEGHLSSTTIVVLAVSAVLSVLLCIACKKYRRLCLKRPVETTDNVSCPLKEHEDGKDSLKQIVRKTSTTDFNQCTSVCGHSTSG